MSGEKRGSYDSRGEEAAKRGRYDPNNYFIDCGDLSAGDAQRNSPQSDRAGDELNFPDSFGPPLEYSPESDDNYLFCSETHPVPENDMHRRNAPFRLEGYSAGSMLSFTRDQSSSLSGDWTLFSHHPSALISGMGSLPLVSEKKESKNNPRCIHGKIKYVCKGRTHAHWL